MGSKLRNTPLTPEVSDPLKGGIDTSFKNVTPAPPQGGLRGVFYLLLITHFSILKAQEPIFTLNQFTPLLYHPASPVIDHAASVSFFHEEYTIGSGDYITTNVVNAEFPFVETSTGHRYLGLGLNFLERDLGQSDLLKTYNAGISLSGNVQLSSEHTLGLGISGNYVNRRTSMENLSTGSQWIASEFRYNPNAHLGEAFTHQKINYVSLGTGLLWQWQEDGRQKAFAGISAFHLNKPRESFFEEAVEVPVTYLFNAGSTVFENQKIAFTPQVFVSRTLKVNTYRVIGSTKIFFKNTNPYDLIRSGNVDLLVNYAFRQDAALGLVFNQPGFSVGMSYHFPLGGSNEVYLENGLQLGVSLSRLRWKKEPQRVVIVSNQQRRKFDFSDQRAPEIQESEIEKINNKLEELDEVKSLQFELSKDFKFEFGKADLSTDAEPFLNELITMMRENPNYQLKIIGHTDNVGRQHINYELSFERAQIVADYLVEKGISASSIEVLGMGDTDPLVSNDTEEAKAKNRRVEFIISIER